MFNDEKRSYKKSVCINAVSVRKRFCVFLYSFELSDSPNKYKNMIKI